MNVSAQISGSKARFGTLLAIALLSLMTLFGVGSAQAHDELVASTPANGAVLKTSPEKFVLTFSGDLKEIGTIVELKDEKGQSIQTSYEITRRDLNVTPDATLPNGDYTLVVRVVSSDGHPIDKKLTFSVQDPQAVESATPTPAATPAPSAAPSSGAATAPAPEQQSPANQLAGLPTTVVWIIAGVVVLGSILMILLKVRRQGK
ncbi:copper resistance CopC family protein [Paeniglutamicibacter kerguelensis]|uniref:Methionine-rich copper-binding protein CopC n=1 Tax=Paeniglutamicibacter kerguelensis TaxID=254788 RepID=A0ABS4XFK4_9MICC|nr:copper resistance protein CopC [Paeniglutamicibacter kerguelensis]MBP2387229.1 methionine-rich copper-binding protein CopC [Paeniglutamicibacter kerguelensis]